MGNRQRIIEAAIELMNKNGSVVGTNQLTEHLPISPGNLYYHFRNREEILIEVLTRLRSDLDAQLELAPGETLDAGRLARCFTGGARVLWQHRFFFSSAMELVVKDKSLSKQYREFCIRGTAQVRTIVQLAVTAAPGLQKLTTAERDKLAENMWVLWTSWPRYTEVINGYQLQEKEIKRSHEHLALLLKPYLNAGFFSDVIRETKKRIRCELDAT